MTGASETKTGAMMGVLDNNSDYSESYRSVFGNAFDPAVILKRKDHWNDANIHRA